MLKSFHAYLPKEKTGRRSTGLLSYLLTNSEKIDFNHYAVNADQQNQTDYYNLTAVPEAITISMLPLPPIVSKSRSTPIMALAPID